MSNKRSVFQYSLMSKNQLVTWSKGIIRSDLKKKKICDLNKITFLLFLPPPFFLGGIHDFLNNEG